MSAEAIMERAENKPLSNKQKVFVDEYLKCFNASEAARRAGYKSKPNVIGSELLANPSIKAIIDARIAESQMSADEALKLLAEQARGDIGDLLDDNGLLDFRKAREKGMTKLLRKIKQKTITRIGKSDDDDDVEITEIEFDMYDAQTALDKILRVHGKYKDNLDMSTAGQALTVKIITGAKMDEI